MTDNAMREAFEKWTESYYEGDFAKYADGEYVTPRQQDDFTMFCTGYQAAHAHLLERLRSDEAKAVLVQAVGGEVGSVWHPEETLEALIAMLGGKEG